ncbi:MAG TPA: cyclic pyranopterin monophosphate synthase MoaC, partial [Minicystis sp.]|nr:cyclic pyranopterin monophosphate synthase MoaC [Minicystis sp.]
GGVSSTPGSPRDGAGRAAVTDVPSSPRSPQPAPGAYSIATPNSVRGAAIGVMRPRTSTAASSHKGASSHRSPPTEPAITLSPRGAPAEAFRRVGSHVDDAGQVHMVGVGDKPATARRAVARALVRMKPETAALVVSGAAGKGEVLATARLAGIMAAKRTPEIVPLCHHVALTRVAIDLEIDAGAGRVRITSTAEAVDRTGVEMEAMVAASVAGLTIYDMLKGVDRDIELESVYLVEKSGGKTGHYIRAERGT